MHTRLFAPLTALAFAAVAVAPLCARAASLSSADCINCNSTPTADIMWTGPNADVGWPYVPPASFDLAEVDTNFAAALGADRTVTAEVFQGIPGQPGATLLGSVSFNSSLAHGQLGGAPFPQPVSLTAGQQYFIGFLNVSGLGLNVDADNDFRGPSSDPDGTPDSCDQQIPANPSCDPDGAALRLLGGPSVGGLHIDTDGSGTFANVDNDLAPVALDAPILNLLAPAATPTPTAPTSDVSCVGDCNDDGQVTINEIVTLVNIALGNAQNLACPNGIPSGSQVDVTLIIRAVSNALNGCTSAATPTPTPTETSATPGGGLTAAAAVAGHTTVAIKATTVIADVIAAVASGLQFESSSAVMASGTSAFTPYAAPGGQGAGACPLGGTAVKSGNPLLGETITLTDCTVATFNGSVVFNGSFTFALLSGSANINVQATFKDSSGTVIETASATIAGSGTPNLTSGACQVSGLTLTATGTLSTMVPSGPTIAVNFGGTTVTIDNVTFSNSCVPTVFDVTLDGQAGLLDPDGGTEAVTFNQLVIHVDGSSGSSTQITVNGGMQSPCFGGTIMLATQTPLSVPANENCPTAGVIVVTLAGGGQAQVTFQSDQSVVIHSGASGTLTAPNCFDPRLLACAA